MAVYFDSEFLEEERHLAYTKKYMEKILEETKEIQEKYKGNMQQALAELNDKDSSSGYTSLLSNTKFLEMAGKEIDLFNRVKDKPYFARIDFRRDGQSFEDVFYLGKTSLYERETQEPIIIDWRAPVASLYYDGRLGEVSYESYEGIEKGFLAKKRQYTIEKGKLIHYADVDMTANDELLLEALAGKADNRLTEIISTIQAEQNRVIRADLKKPIIVQGAAGSGKTTIALHRISYFIYHLKERFDPRQMMIIAPNRMFIDYIASVLPELGVDKILQTTYVDYVLKCIGVRIKVIKPEEKLISLINNQTYKENLIRFTSEFKGSLKYKKLLDRYLKDLREQLSPKEDFYLEKFRLETGKKLEKLFKKDYSYLPFYTRLEKIQNVLKTNVRQKKKLILDKLQKLYDEQLEHALFHIKNKELRKKRVVSIMDKKEERLKSIQNEVATCVKAYMNYYQKDSLIGYYKSLFDNFEKFSEYANGLMTDEQCKFLFESTKANLNKNEVEIEDLGAIYYLQSIIFGISKNLKPKNVVIDEAQDYSVFQLYALKKGLETEIFTIVGDLAQGIHSYRGLKSWDVLRDVVFPEANYVTLQKSYRTTIEIMNVANSLFELMDDNLPKVEPVVRHGQKPEYVEYLAEKELVENVERIVLKVKEKGFSSIACITKTDGESLKLYKLLKKKIEHPFQLLKENEGLKDGHIAIVPSYLSKGLEFDVVIIVAMDERFMKDEIDIKLLYVAMTRPMHELYFIAKSKEALLLHEIKI